MTIYDIAVVGAGPAGMMAAIRARQLDKKTVLIERNDCIGKKMLLTGKGRCNVTNSAKIDTFIEKFGKTGQFLRTAFSAFSNEDLMDFLKSKGLELKTERQGRVFPASDKAKDVVDTMLKALTEAGVEIKYKTRVKNIAKKGGTFLIETWEGPAIEAGKVILSTGGASYKDTGSTGEGFQIAKALTHTIKELRGGLVPLRAKEEWAKDLQGLALKNVRIIFTAGKNKKQSEIGELMFTHFGVSGPLVLDLSADIVSLIKEHKEVKLSIDLKPGIRAEEMENKLLREFRDHGGKEIKNVLGDMLPSRLVPVMMKLTGIDGKKVSSQIGKEERHALAKNLKALVLTVTGSLATEEAMVTCGGVSVKEINPRTMESKVVPGLYFAGEIIAGGAPSGGYNLQQAFSTGYLAGGSAANA